MKKLSLIIIVLVAFATTSSYAWSYYISANSEAHPHYGDSDQASLQIPPNHEFHLVMDAVGNSTYPATAIAASSNFWHEISNRSRAYRVTEAAANDYRTLLLYVETEKWTASIWYII